MNAIDVDRNKLARLGLHPGARHPNIADSTPVRACSIVCVSVILFERIDA